MNRFDEIGDPAARGEDETVAMLRGALAREAEMVQPREDGMTLVRERLDAPGRRPGWVPWVPWVAGLAAAAVVGVVAGGLVDLGRDDEQGRVADPAPSVSQSTVPTEDTTQPSPDPTVTTSDPAPTSTPLPAVGDALPVYWVGEQGSRSALFREFVADGPADTGQRVQAAVTAALSGRPVDPDYASPWADGAAATTTVSGSEILIDLDAAAASTELGTELAELVVEQLVWTATAAASQNLPVRVTVEGGTPDLFGSVNLAAPFTRAGGLDDPRGLVWVDLPEGATVPAGQVTIEGEGVNAFENTLEWTLERNDDPVGGGGTEGEGFFGVSGPGGEPVDTGQRGRWSLTVQVEPGTYTLTVMVPDASGGAEGSVRSYDTKTLTVT